MKKFVRLAESRTNTVLKIELLGNLSNRRNYGLYNQKLKKYFSYRQRIELWSKETI